MKSVYIEVKDGETRIALTEDGRLAELYTGSSGISRVGNIYKGRVVSLLPGMQAAFIDIGLDKNAFLHAGDIIPGHAEAQKGVIPPITKTLRCGQELAVQVEKEPGGDKGPRVTTNLALAGRMLVLLLKSSYLGVSKKIPDSERERLTEIAKSFLKEDMGLIVRTAATDATREDFARDIEYLESTGSDILSKYTKVSAPALLHQEIGFSERVLRDMSMVSEIIIDDAETHNRLRETFSNEPQIFEALRLLDDGGAFTYGNLDSQISKLLSKKVWLKSGGYIVIEHTEAMTVIDVNTGKFVGSKRSDDTFLKLNLEAAAEIAAQLRLRDIGGIIVIDFIDMDEPSQREVLVEAFREHLKKDRSKTNVVGMSPLGLVEMTRKRKYAG